MYEWQNTEKEFRNRTLTLLSRSYQLSVYDRERSHKSLQQNTKNAHNDISSQGLQRNSFQKQKTFHCCLRDLESKQKKTGNEPTYSVGVPTQHKEAENHNK
jgi:hypothetical protein